MNIKKSLCIFVSIISLVYSVSLSNDKEAKEKQRIADHLQSISVTLQAESSGVRVEGSGVIKTIRVKENGKDEYISYVWTAAHVVAGLRSEKSFLDTDGRHKQVVRFQDAVVVQELAQNGRRVGETRMIAQIIRYSKDEDLAVLKVRKKNFIIESVKFNKTVDGVTPIGTDVYHVGSMSGKTLGANSMTNGIIAQVGRILEGQPFDQTTVTATNGSSGGGVYTRDGVCIGLVTIGVRTGDNFNFIVPIRRIAKWAKSAGVEWALYDGIKMPVEKEMKKMPIEDTGVKLHSSSGEKLSLEYKYLIRKYENGKLVDKFSTEDKKEK